MSFYEQYGKRVVDIALSLLGLLFFSPILLILSVIIRLENRGTTFFCQDRVGKGGKIFRLIKFRTMVIDKEKEALQFTPGDKQRVTQIGNFLRKTKLDEIPALINVLKGEMSIVGPRAEVPKYLSFYTGEKEKILSIKPGITDFASIKYRNEEELLANSAIPEKLYEEIILPDKLRMNLNYLNSISFWSDMKIILNTIKVIFRAIPIDIGTHPKTSLH